MDYKIDLNVKEKFIDSIRKGLHETQSKYRNDRRIKNAKHFVKMDDIANSVIETFESNPKFKIITFPRGPSYELVLIYDTESNILYSLMSSKRFQQLLNRKDRSKVHYLDVLVNFNDKLEIERHQLVIDEKFFQSNIEKINQIKDNLMMLLNGVEPAKYMTIAFGMDRFRLLSVEVILTSAYLEIASREDWSELIEIDYSDLSYEEVEIASNFDELDISIKPHVVRNEDISEEHIIPKVDKQENQL